MMTTGPQLAFIAVISVWLIFSFFSNVFVVAILLRIKRIRSVTHIFLCNLAVSDLVLVAFVLPQQVHDISHSDDYFEPEYLCKMVNFLPIFSITSSIYSIVAMAEERCGTITSQRVFMGKSAALKLVVVIWLAAVMVASPMGLIYGIRQEAGNSTSLICVSTVSYELDVTIGFVVIAISYVIPQVIICKAYFTLGIFIDRQARVHPTDVVGRMANAFVLRNKTRTIKMCVVVAVLFSLSWLPYFTILAISKVSIQPEKTTIDIGYMAQVALAAFSSSYNGVVYTIYNKDFRRELIHLFCPKKWRQQETQLTTVGPIGD